MIGSINASAMGDELTIDINRYLGNAQVTVMAQDGSSTTANTYYVNGHTSFTMDFAGYTEGHYSLTITLQDVPYKIVYYVDSLGCMSCKLKLEEWSKFIHEADSLSKGKVSVFFYFHPKRKNLKELRYTLETHSFDYPVCIDTLDRFNARNIFQENDSFHTFLLDASNKVAVIGNPVLSPEIKELYLQVMTGKKNDAKVQVQYS